MKAPSVPALILTVVLTPAMGYLDAGGQGQVYRARTDAVSVPVSVWAGDVLVPGLPVEAFELFDKGVRQQIATVSAGATPIDVTVILDTSGSVQGDMLARMTADARATAVLTPDDRIRVLTFGTTVREVLPLQSVPEQPLAGDFSSGGGTTLFQAIVASLLTETTAGRPHLAIALSDGFDNTSLLGAATVRDLARYSDTILYVILPGVRSLASPCQTLHRFSCPPPSDRWSFPEPGDLRQLRDAAEITGGTLYTPPSDGSSGDELRRVLTEFRSGYVLWYSPAGVDPDGWHDIEVRVPGMPYTVRARQGYFGR